MPLKAARRDALVVLAGLALVLAWEVSGLDRRVMAALGTPSGFPWRDAVLTRTLLHDGSRLLAAGLLLAGLFDALRPHADGPTRAQRLGWWAMVPLTMALVPLIKRQSATSCPWDWQVFGGTAQPLPHWLWGVADGGAGRCFPSGHATTAFGFLAVYFLWREADPARARHGLWAVLLAGLLVGGTQVVRGAHAPSHVLWTAWLSWSVMSLAAALVASGRAGQAGDRLATPTAAPGAPGRAAAWGRRGARPRPSGRGRNRPAPAVPAARTSAPRTGPPDRRQRPACGPRSSGR